MYQLYVNFVLCIFIVENGSFMFPTFFQSFPEGQGDQTETTFKFLLHLLIHKNIYIFSKYTIKLYTKFCRKLLIEKFVET